MNSPLVHEALADHEPYANVNRALAQVDHARRGLTAGHDVRAEQAAIVTETVAAVQSGDPVPHDLGARLMACAAKVDEDAVAAKALETVEAQLEAERARVLRDSRDVVLRWLAVRLDGLLAQVAAAVEVCGPVRGAEQALAAGADVAAAWRSIDQAVPRYRAIRAAQLEAVVGPSGTNQDRAKAMVLRAGLIRNALTVDPYQRERLAPRDVTRDGDIRLNEFPWPGANGVRWPFEEAVVPSDQPAAYLAWLASAGVAEPWLPGLEELHDHAAAMDAAVREAEAAAGRAEDLSPEHMPIRS